MALVTGSGNPEGSCVLAMPLTTADIGTQLLMDSTVNLQEIEARITARVFAVVNQPERGLRCEGCWSSCWRCWMPPERMG